MSTLTLHLAMTYFDIITENLMQPTPSWQFNAFTCFVLASKFQERDDNVPLIDDMIRSLNITCIMSTNNVIGQ